MSFDSLGARPRLLVALARRDADDRLHTEDLRALVEVAEWEALLGLAAGHRLEGLILAALERMDSRLPVADRLFPAERFETLRLLRRQSIGWDLEQARVLAWLEKHGVTPIVLKGSSLRHEVYAEPTERPVSDLDLLFRPEDLETAHRTLSELGYEDPNTAAANALYREHHFHTQLRHPSGFALELHWGLTLPGPQARIDPAVVIREARRVPGKSRPLFAPRPEHMVLHLASQSVEDSVSRLGRIVDTDRVIAYAGNSFDWERLASMARSSRLQNGVGVTLRIAERLFDTPVPSKFVEDLGISRLARANLAALSPVRWVIEQQAFRMAAASVIMRFWLETTSEGRADVVVKALGLRTDPLKLLHDELVDSEPFTESRLLKRVPAFLKISGYQAVIWSRSAARLARGGAAQQAFW